MAVRLREMRWWDIDTVLALERELFPEDAWSPGMFWSELAYARGPQANRHYVVAEAGDRLVGYAGLAAVDGTGEVQTIAAARDQWGTGLGARLLTDLLAAGAAFDCHRVLLEVRVDNARAQRLYERFGFAPIGVRKGYYQPGNVDALVMCLADLPSALPEATGPPGPTGTETETGTGTADPTGTGTGTSGPAPEAPAARRTTPVHGAPQPHPPHAHAPREAHRPGNQEPPGTPGIREPPGIQEMHGTQGTQTHG